jgi:hypothetical protein
LQVRVTLCWNNFANRQASLASGFLWYLSIAVALRFAAASCPSGSCDTQYASCCSDVGGYNVPAPNCSSGCFVCPAGTYYYESLLLCLKCTSGNYSQSSGSSSCTPCPPGTFSSATGKPSTRKQRVCAESEEGVSRAG